MFKYLRNINGSTPPTETVTFEVYQLPNEHLDIQPGMIVSITGGIIETIFNYKDPLYLTISSSEDSYEANCIKILPGMVFEADIHSSVSTSDIYTGSYCGIYIDNYGKGTHLKTSDEENVFQVIDASNKSKKKATVVVM